MMFADTVTMPPVIWDDLRAAAAGRVPEAWDGLEMLGLAEDGSLTERALTLTSPLSAPLGIVRLQMSVGGRRRDSVVFTDGSRAGVMITTADDAVRLSRFESGMLPIVFIETVGLAPRPIVDGDTSVPSDAVTRILDGPGEDLPFAHEELSVLLSRVWTSVGDAMTDDRWRLWTVESILRVEGEERTVGRLSVLDTEAGIFVAEVGRESAAILATSVYGLWMSLARLLAAGA